MEVNLGPIDPPAPASLQTNRSTLASLQNNCLTLVSLPKPNSPALFLLQTDPLALSSVQTSPPPLASPQTDPPVLACLETKSSTVASPQTNLSALSSLQTNPPALASLLTDAPPLAPPQTNSPALVSVQTDLELRLRSTLARADIKAFDLPDGPLRRRLEQQQVIQEPARRSAHKRARSSSPSSSSSQPLGKRFCSDSAESPAAPPSVAPAPSTVTPAAGSPPGPSPGQPSVKKKKLSQASIKRSLERQRTFIAEKDPGRPVHALPISLTDLPQRGEYQGKARHGSPAKPTCIVEAGSGWPNTRGAALVDRAGRLIGLRAFGYGEKPREINNIAIEAVKELEASTRPEKGPGHERGFFAARLFSIHRSQTLDPCHNVYMLRNLEQAQRFALKIKPIVDYAEGIFRSNFPLHHAQYRSIMSELVNHPNLPAPLLNLFGPWACCCINSGGRAVSLLHTDAKNYPGNFCVIIPFDTFDYQKSARLVIDVGGGHTVAFELPPGIPFFLPSSLLAHYNTAIVGDDERRGSLVFWMPGPVVQWLALGGRPEKDLTPAEIAEWVKGLQARAQEMLGRYPILQTHYN